MAHNETVIVYDDRSTKRNGGEAWRALRRQIAALVDAPSHDDLIAALIGFGEFESAVADAVCADGDHPHPALPPLRAIAEALGLAVAASWTGDAAKVRPAVRLAAALCGSLDAQPWPQLGVTEPEGYAFYGVYPETYVDAALTWSAGERPSRVLCLGLRSIGTSLSAAVTGALRLRDIPARSWTLRPTGDPFDRRVALSPELAAALDIPKAVVLAIDEGPGLSGSSMAGAAGALSSLGVPDDRIVFMPSHCPSPDRFVSPSAAARWRRHRLIVPRFDAIRQSLADSGAVPADAEEISAGAWRSWFGLPAPWPEAHAQHERRKYVSRSTRLLARFAGLGARGRDVAGIAGLLGEAGWAPRSVQYARGFLTVHVIDGTPLVEHDAPDAFLQHAAAYVAWRQAHLRTGAAARTDALAGMLRANTLEALGNDWLAAADILSEHAARFNEPAVAIDGRLLPHEWLAHGAGWTKADAWDHHRDHFLPGCSDAAWDVAGLLVEFGVTGSRADVVLDQYVRRSGDRTIAQRLPFYTAAYCAFRAGYAMLAAATLAGTEDARRFAALDGRYRRALRTTLAGVRRAAPSER